MTLVPFRGVLEIFRRAPRHFCREYPPGNIPVHPELVLKKANGDRNLTLIDDVLACFKLGIILNK